MGQITWRNIDAPDFSQAGRLLEVGTRNISDAFTAGQNLIGQQQQIELANFENARKRNTADIQNQLLGFKTPEEMAAAQAQFTPEALKARFGAAYDQSQINQLVAERPGQLRQDLTSQIQLGNLQQQEAAEPFVQQYYSMLATDPRKAAQFLEENKSSLGDTRLLYDDLNKRVSQQEELNLKRAELADSRATNALKRSILRDQRTSEQIQTTRAENERSFAQKLFSFARENPGVPLGTKGNEILSMYPDIDPVRAGAIINGVGEGVNTLSTLTPTQSAEMQGFATDANEDITGLNQELTTDLDRKFAGTGVNQRTINALDNKELTKQQVIDYIAKTRLDDDVGSATAYYADAEKVLGSDSPALIQEVLIDAYTNNYFVGHGSYNKIGRDSVADIASKYKKTVSDTTSLKAYRSSMRELQTDIDSLTKQAASTAAQFELASRKRNLGLKAPEVDLNIPDTASIKKKWEGITKMVGDTNVNTTTVPKYLSGE